MDDTRFLMVHFSEWSKDRDYRDQNGCHKQAMPNQHAN